jgi:hypothetical protein
MQNSFASILGKILSVPAIAGESPRVGCHWRLVRQCNSWARAASCPWHPKFAPPFIKGGQGIFLNNGSNYLPVNFGSRFSVNARIASL